MSEITTEQAKKDIEILIDQIAESHQPITITGERNQAILVSQQDWLSIQETLYLLSIPGMRESIKEGLNTPIDECVEELDW
jgi:antitoxin YefM